jgi:hypothetical protein
MGQHSEVEASFGDVGFCFKKRTMINAVGAKSAVYPP